MIKSFFNLAARSVLLCLLMSFAAVAQTTTSTRASDAPEQQVTLESGVQSQYLVPGLLYVGHHDIVVGTRLQYSRKRNNKTFSLGFADTQGIEKCICTEGEELDPFAELLIEFRSGRKLRMRLTQLVLSRAVESDFVNPLIEYSRGHSLPAGVEAEVFAAVEAFLRTNSRGPRSGVLVWVGGSVRKEFGKWNASLRVQAGHDPFGAGNFRPHTLLHWWDAEAGYKFTDSFGVSVSATFAGSNFEDRPGSATFGLKLRKTFDF